MLKFVLLVAVAVAGSGAVVWWSSPRASGAEQVSPQQGDRAVYLTRDTTGYRNGDLLGLLPADPVVSVPQLSASIGPNTEVIIIDASVATDDGLTSVLNASVRQGKSVIGLNVPLADLRALTGFDQAVEANRIDILKSPQLAPAPSPASVAVYSYVSMSPTGSEVRRFGQGQKALTAATLGPDLARLTAGAYKNLPVMPAR